MVVAVTPGTDSGAARWPPPPWPVGRLPPPPLVVVPPPVADVPPLTVPPDVVPPAVTPPPPWALCPVGIDSPPPWPVAAGADPAAPEEEEGAGTVDPQAVPTRRETRAIANPALTFSG